MHRIKNLNKFLFGQKRTNAFLEKLIVDKVDLEQLYSNHTIIDETIPIYALASGVCNNCWSYTGTNFVNIMEELHAKDKNLHDLIFDAIVCAVVQSVEMALVISQKPHLEHTVAGRYYQKLRNELKGKADCDWDRTRYEARIGTYWAELKYRKGWEIEGIEFEHNWQTGIGLYLATCARRERERERNKGSIHVDGTKAIKKTYELSYEPLLLDLCKKTVDVGFMGTAGINMVEQDFGLLSLLVSDSIRKELMSNGGDTFDNQLSFVSKIARISTLPSEELVRLFLSRLMKEPIETWNAYGPATRLKSDSSLIEFESRLTLLADIAYEIVQYGFPIMEMCTMSTVRAMRNKEMQVSFDRDVCTAEYISVSVEEYRGMLKSLSLCDESIWIYDQIRRSMIDIGFYRDLDNYGSRQSSRIERAVKEIEKKKISISE